MIQVYTGNGKGKTTAALGLALRAAGAGLRVYIAQFMKSGVYSEVQAVKKMKNITLEQFGKRGFIRRQPVEEDIKLAEQGFKKIERIVSDGNYDVIVLDEINMALHLKLLNVQTVIDLANRVSLKTELIFTGRCAPPEIIRIADLVSRIEDVKHYYKKNLPARRGIEF